MSDPTRFVTQQDLEHALKRLKAEILHERPSLPHTDYRPVPTAWVGPTPATTDRSGASPQSDGPSYCEGRNGSSLLRSDTDQRGDPRQPRSPAETPGEAAAAVARHHRITVRDLLGWKRTRRFATARTDLMHRLRAAGRTLEEIGQATGGRDHTTVLYHLTKKPGPKARSGA